MRYIRKRSGRGTSSECLLCGKDANGLFCDGRRSEHPEAVRYEKYYGLQIVLLLIPIAVVPTIVLFEEYALAISSLFCLSEGGILFVFPFSIPDTAKSIGLENDFRVNGKIAVLFSVVGGLFLLAFFLFRG